MIDFKKLITADFLFGMNALTLSRADKVFLALGITLAVSGAIFKLVFLGTASPVTKTLARRLAKLFFTIGILEVVWFGARYENITFFGTRFFALLLLAVGLAWFIVIAKYFFTKYRPEREAWNKDQMKQKYLNR